MSALRRRSAARPVDPHDAEAAREAALRLLERVRRTRGDLARRLREKGFAPETVEGTLARLESVGLVDDVEFARAFLAGRLRRRSAGWRRLEQELRGRGVSAEDIARGRQRLEEEGGGPPAEDAGAPSATDEATARRVVAQAARRYGGLDPRVRRQRLTALLLRRGFDFETIQSVLAMPPEDDPGLA
jgi:regulatory protein